MQRILRVITAVAITAASGATGMVWATPVSAQEPTRAEIARFTAARAIAVKAAPGIWPGFRPDTIPLQLVMPERGTLLLGWSGKVPAGYRKLGASSTALWIGQADRGAASTATALGDRTVAQVVVTDTGVTELAGLIAHESFHAFERSVKSKTVRFGSGENSYYVSQYPVYDVGNETMFALELAVLSDALNARTTADARTFARQFVAVRTARQKDMNPEVAEFEAMSELNEGLAEYALVRASAAATSKKTAAGSATATVASRAMNLLTATNLSVRLRYYVTGSGQALMLDRVGPADWKTRLMKRNVTMLTLLSEALGAPAAPALVADAERAHPRPPLEAAAQTRVKTLQASVRARADSLMNAPGVHFTLDGSATGLASCGFDPQNMLQLGGGALLHTRWLRVCTHGIELEFNTAVVQDGNQAKAVIGNSADITLTADGNALAADANGEYRNVKIVSRGVTGTIVRARVVRTAGSITITPLQP